MNETQLKQLFEYSFKQNAKKEWYMLAIAVLTASNAPEDIAQIFLLELVSSLPENKSKSTDWLIETVIKMIEDPVLLNTTFHEVSSVQRTILSKVKECILKISAIVGIPRAINGLRYVRLYTPASLLSDSPLQIDANTHYIDRTHTVRKDEDAKSAVQDVLQRGMRHWNTTYGKVSNRVIEDLNQFYPDLWQFIIKDVYGDILSYNDIVSGPVTSLLMISSLVPMDVNPQLRGHLRGALNFGWNMETINEVRSFAILIAQWHGIKWKSEVTKL